MSQDKNSGRKSNKLGKVTGRALARQIGGEPCGGNSNKFIWKGKYAVMKTASPGNNVIGVYGSMLECVNEPLEIVVAAYRDPGGNAFSLYALDVADFRAPDISRPSKYEKNPPQRHASRKAIEERSRESRANERHGIPRRVTM